ncbi:hypothetical protein G4D82_07550 [Flavobacterium sp. CYK-4]|uniref:DUF6428 family protein n=1 Tax=Flavobacterium lotistagni TaxID=2709660 RepID=UPI001408716E|nr:DUF6428 family protein [Flavobacterium lotistagni]NHM07072.1 hypothetical protein [Flavobacterium lotistagni]
MKLSEVKNILQTLEVVKFELESGIPVPEHFHITEIGAITKHFIDCGGTVRTEKAINFQLWNANDLDHRLAPQKLLKIIDLSERTLALEDLAIEVEYQTDTIGKYDLGFNGERFILLSKNTACLASDHCGIPKEQLNSQSKKEVSCCTPGGGCC